MRESEPAVASPLRGIQVVDLTTVMLGPCAAQMLGDYGADVIKVEAPEGDSTRTTGPAREDGIAATFLGANSNQRSVVLDLKQALGREAMFTLLTQADVLLCSVRPQKMRALGLDLEGFKERFPRLVVVAIVGFGDGGPYAGRPAYDDIIQGLCGMASLSERQGGEPAYVPSVVADKTCALFATQAVLMALVQRLTTGRGCHVQVPMFEAMTGLMLMEHLYGLNFEPPARSTAQWLEACDHLDIPAAPMHAIEQLASDPHLKATWFFRHIEDPAMGHPGVPGRATLLRWLTGPQGLAAAPWPAHGRDAARSGCRCRHHRPTPDRRGSHPGAREQVRRTFTGASAPHPAVPN